MLTKLLAPSSRCAQSSPANQSSSGNQMFSDSSKVSRLSSYRSPCSSKSTPPSKSAGMFTGSIMTCCAFSSMAGFPLSPPISSWGTTSIGGGKESRQSACSLRLKSSTPSASSCCGATMSLPPSPKSTVSMRNVLSSQFRQKQIQRQALEEFRGLLQLHASRCPCRGPHPLHAWGTIPRTHRSRADQLHREAHRYPRYWPALRFIVG